MEQVQEYHAKKPWYLHFICQNKQNEFWLEFIILTRRSLRLNFLSKISPINLIKVLSLNSLKLIETD